MSYLVLARKWRPRRFSELVGQEHVVRALSNALETGRVHHAFLFTGTRGVGKTTIARIFAKSLNCIQGVGAEPCGECEICQAVDQGRFVDLLEIDAASNTGVDDVRELIDNAQYLPTRGRYKVYLVDEVHMLSRNAFNALLKTLEEPPEHVKFLLATTDPQKLPATVLSRCLQFNLRRLTQEQIGGQMRHILDAESVPADDEAIAELARAADGSLRDGLSLLDQALAFGGGRVQSDDVRGMLGSVDRNQISGLLDALSANDGACLMQVAEDIAGFAPDFAGVLDELAHALHRIQLTQLVPDLQVEAEGIDVASLAAALPPETVQLWYQMALLGRRDIDLAPSPRVGFEMTLLRMLAFQPAAAPGDAPRPEAPRRDPAAAPASRGAAPGDTQAAARNNHYPPAPASSPPPPAARIAESAAPAAAQPTRPAAAAVAAPQSIHDNESWLQVLSACAISGPARELGANLAFVSASDGRVKVHLPPVMDYLRSGLMEQQLVDALGAVLGSVPKLEFVSAPAAANTETLGDRTRRENQARHDDARAAFAADPAVRELVAGGAQIRTESVRPRDDG